MVYKPAAMHPATCGLGIFAALLLLPSSLAAGELEIPVPLQIGGWDFSHDTIIMSAIVALLIYVVCWAIARKFSPDNPGRGQVILEMVVSAFDGLVKQAMGPNRGRKYLPYIGTLFIFVWSCNMIGLVPVQDILEVAGVHQLHLFGEDWQDYNHNGIFDPGEPFTDANHNNIHDPGFRFPHFEEPTSNLNVPLGLALLFVLIIGHGSEIYYHGVKGYLKSYFSPGGFIGICMFPLNIVGKMAELVSISFRLFGNIFGGVVIIVVVSGLLHYMFIPVGLYFFFGIFVGTVQAFVFTMLALTYISAGAAEGEE